MSIVQTDKIDFIGTDDVSNTVVLTISDHLDWSDTHNHLVLLQEKLNSYLAFCESEQLLEKYPQAKGKRLVIQIVGKSPLPVEGQNFIDQAKEVIEEVGIELQFSLLEE